MGMICIETATGRVREWVRNGQPSTYDPDQHTLLDQEEPPSAGTIWDGTDWVADIQSPTPHDLARADARTRIDDVLSDPTPGPAKFKAAFAALKRVLG